MDLKRFVSPKKEVEEKYWSVVIEPDWVQSGIWIAQDGKVEVLSFSKPLPWSGEENLVDVVDSSLSVSVGNLAEDDLEISKTVFGLSSSWVTPDGGIKQEYQDLIKNVCQELSLKPVGFVVLSEALAFYFKSEEKVPLNAIIVGLGEKNVSVSLFIEGVNKGEVIVSRSLSVTDDIAEGLSRFLQVSSFPPRILLFNGREGELEDVLQEITSVDWSGFEGISFLHLPKVEVIDLEEKIKAVSLAGGVELLGATSVLIKEAGKEVSFDVEKEIGLAESKETDDSGYQDEKSLQGDNFSSVEGDVGFVVDKDIKEIGEKVIGKQISRDGFKENFKEIDGGFEEGFQPVRTELPGGDMFEKNLGKRGFIFRNIFKKQLSSISLFSYKTPILVGIVTFILVFLGFFVAWWFLPKASVIVYLSPKKIESKQEVVFDATAKDVDLRAKTIPSNLIKREQSGEKTIPTSGTKLTGEKAKGKIVIYRTGSQLSLDKGTKVQNSSGLTFVLDEDVTVASGSASSPAKTEAQVTAADIGSEYNLASGESFTIGNYPSSEIEAKNEESFSGGSSREISSVSSADYDNVLSELKKELRDKAISAIKSSLSSDDYLIEETLIENEKQKVYDHKIGDEATSLKLSLTMEFSAFSFKKYDMFEFSKEILKDQITSGYVLREGQLSLGFDVKEIKNDKAFILASFSANLLPAIDADQIKKKIVGRKIKFVEDYLIKESGYEKVKIDIVPGIFNRFGFLPHVSNNIEVGFESSR